MATRVQRRRGTTVEHSTFTGAVGETTVDTTKDTVVVHDAVTAGGHPLAKEARAINTTAPITGGGTLAADRTLAISNNGITNALLAQMAANTIKGNNTGGAANALDLTTAQITAMIDHFTSALRGSVPASGGGTSNFLRADGTWSTPPAGGTYDLAIFVDDNGIATGSANAAANTAAINALLTTYAGQSVNFVFGTGDYYFDKISGIRASIHLNSTHTAAKKFTGQGRHQTTLIMQGAGNAGEWHLFHVESGFNKLEIADMGMMHGIVGSPDPIEQNHIVNFSATTARTGDHYIHDCHFGQSIGSPIRFLGTNGGFNVEDSIVFNCTMNCYRTKITATTAWAISTAYTVGNYRTNSGNVYKCVVAGTSAASGGPSGTGVGITDGTCTWIYIAANSAAWTVSTAYAFDDVRLNGGNVYKCAVAGTSAGSGGPSGTGSAITDGTVTWSYVGAGTSGYLAHYGGRSCLEFQRGYKNITIGRCYLKGAKNSPLDFEASVDADQYNARFFDVTFDNSLGETYYVASFGGSSSASPGDKITIDHCVFLHGQVQFINTRDCVIRNSLIYYPGGVNYVVDGLIDTNPLLYIYRDNDNLFLDGLTVIRGATGQGGALVNSLAYAGPVYPKNVKIDGGFYHQATNNAFFQMETCDGLQMDDVNMTMTYATPTAQPAIQVRSVAADCEKINISGCKLTVTGSKMLCFAKIVTGGTIETHINDVVITGNNAADAVTYGAIFDVPTVTAPISSVEKNPILQGNNFDGATNHWVASNNAANIVFPVVQGGVGKGTSRILEGTVTPETNAVGNLGDLYRWQPSSTTSEIYHKASQSGASPTAVGWVLLQASPVAANSIKGNNTGATANALDLTAAQVTAMLDVATSGAKGLAPASGGGSTNFLRADLTWAAPSGGSGSPGGSSGQVQWNNAAAFDGATNVNIDSGDLLLDDSTPATPSAGVKLFASAHVGRSALAMIDSLGVQNLIATDWARRAAACICRPAALTPPLLWGSTRRPWLARRRPETPHSRRWLLARFASGLSARRAQAR